VQDFTLSHDERNTPLFKAKPPYADAILENTSIGGKMIVLLSKFDLFKSQMRQDFVNHKYTHERCTPQQYVIHFYSVISQ